MGKVYKLDQYRKEAKIEPFVLDLDDAQISIPSPTGETLLQISEISMFEGRKLLQLLAGEQFDALWAALKDEDGSILVSLLRDMVGHFKVGSIADAPGGPIALPR